MGDLADRRLLLVSARADFLEGTDPDLHGVPDHVAASWRRSASSGVHPGEVSSEYFSDLDVNSRLVRCAQPVIEHLAEQVADVPVCVALTDDRARLLARRDSNSWIGRMLDRVYFAQGFGYAEGSVGTNGVGTVLEFGRSVHIVGAEHYVDSLQTFACAGAPIRDPFSGRIEGVLDISCLSDHSTPIMHSLVRASAAEVERNLLTDRNQLQQALFDVYTRIDARTRDAVLAVGPQILMANPAMQTMLVGTDQEALHDHVRFVMHRHPTVDDRLDLPSGLRVRLRGSTISMGHEVAGMVAVVSPIEEPHDRHRLHIPRQKVASPQLPPGAAATPERLVWGSCPAWRSAARTVEDALAGGDPVLLLGEPGVGRFTLLAELHRPTGSTAGIDPDTVAVSPAATAERLLRPGTTLHVLRDIDRLPAPAVNALVDVLTAGPEAPDGPRRFAATATDTGRPDAPYRRLLALFHASATVPPLRNRSADLHALVAAALTDLAPHRDVRLSPGALRLLGRHRWPGNVRELEDALAHALRRRPVGRIEPEDLPAYCQSETRGALREVDRIERDAIVAALRDAGGNRVAAATALGLARSTLYRKIRQYGITA